MSANRTMTQHTVQLFEASRTGDRESVSALLDYDNADINWHCKQAVSETESEEVRTFHFFSDRKERHRSSSRSRMDTLR